jgi:endonuclease/exonuclease/phosphatase family metal-dependent hydrolase
MSIEVELSRPVIWRMATYNIRHGLGTNGVIDLARTAATIRATGARVVALQEVDRFWPRPGVAQGDQPALLAEATGLAVRFFPTLREGGAEYGIALAAAEPFEAQAETLPRVGGEEPRVAIVARLGGLGIVATHLTTSQAAQPVQTSALARLAGGLPDPVVVMGDLNQDRSTLTPLRRAGFRSVRRVPTLGFRQIDHILAGPGVSILRIWAGPRGASDHRPLIAEVELSPPLWSLAGAGPSLE